jgi:hypothetical protein
MVYLGQQRTAIWVTVYYVDPVDRTFFRLPDGSDY